MGNLFASGNRRDFLFQKIINEFGTTLGEVGLPTYTK